MIKKVLQKLKDNFKKYIMNHLGTNILLLLITIVIIVIDLDDTSKIIQRLVVTLFLTAMFTVLAETFTKDNKRRYIIYFIGLLLSIFISKCILYSHLERYLIGTVLLLGSTILFLMANNSKEKTTKYLTNSFTNLFKYGIIGSILNIGLLMILGLISMLLFEIDGIAFAKLEIIIFVLYFIPALIMSLENKEEDNRFIYILVNYVSLPLVLIATIVIYLYLLKLLVTLKLPVTATFGINAVLLTMGIPIVLMALSYDKDKEKLTYKMADILRKLFIPLIPLQIFSLYLRIKEYSLTSTRYFGIILLIIGIVAMVLINKDKGDNFKFILLPCIILSVTSFMIPYINIYELPNYLQINRLKQIMPEGKEFKSLTKKEIEDVRSIYYTVSENKYYPDYLSKQELGNMLFKYNEYDNSYNKYIYYNSTIKKINISDYKEMEEYYYDNNHGLSIKVNNKDYDLSAFCKKVYNYYEEDKVENYIDKEQPIKLDDYTYLYITKITLDYNNKYLDISGYILYK